MPETPTNPASEPTAPPAADAGTRLTVGARALAPARARAGLLRRSARATRRWARDTFSREQLVAGVKQFAWVAPLTVLIWVYAERMQQHKATIPFTVVARSSNPNVHVSIVEPSDGSVQATLQGARNKLERAQERVSSDDPVVINLPFETRPSPNPITMSVAEILDKDPRFAGLAWVEGPGSSPAAVEVLVDPMEEHVLPVQVREQDAERLDAGGGGAVFMPATVKVRLPRKAAEVARGATDGNKLVAYADLSALRDTADGGKQKLSDVRVFVHGADGAEAVTIEPTTVSAAVTLRDADEAYTIPQVPVQMMVTGSLNDYAVELDPSTVFNVEVTGPPAAIAALRGGGEAAVRAYVSLSPENVGEEQETKVSFILPPSVRLLQPDSPAHSVRVTVSPRTSTPE